MSESGGPPRYWDLEQYRTGSGGGDRAPPRPEPRRSVTLAFAGDAVGLFWLAFRSVILAILTLGIYRFWMLAAMRRHYWGAVSIDGDPLEYTGTGLEKFLGFLLALVLLAAYLGLVNLGLAYAGLSYLSGDPYAQTVVLNVSIAATLPFIFYAAYRGQRYALARTRWRGIRFGLEPGAWGYVARAVPLTLLTVATLGLAWPYQHYTMAKYMTDRARYGDLAFEQGGGWQPLLAQWVWIYVAAALGGLIVWGMAENPDDPMAAFFGTLVLILGTLVVVLLVQRYRIAAFRILWSGRTLGGARFANEVSAPRVIAIYVGGGIATGIAAGAVGALFGAVAAALASALGLLEGSMAAFTAEDPARLAAAWPAAVVAALTYLVFFGAAFAFSQVLVTRPVLSAQVGAMTLTGLEIVEASRQRAHDAAAEAGGFADALGVDVGAGL